MGIKKSLFVVLQVFSLVLLTIAFPLVWATEDSWIRLEPMPTARSGFGVAVVDGKIYAIGGSNGSYLAVNEMYDPATDTWTAKKSMPTPRHSFGIAVYQNKIYVIGGSIGNLLSCLKTTEVYDTLTDTWETKSEIPFEGRSSFCANVVNGKIYLIGGRIAPWIYAPLPEATLVYDPEEDSWTKTSSIPKPVYNYVSAVVDNKIYIIGGRSTTAIRPLIQIYDPKNNTWNEEKVMPLAVCRAGAGLTEGVLAPKRIYIIGGKTALEPNETYTDTTQIYDPETDDWTTGIPMPTPRRGLRVAVVNDELYAIGGYDGDTYSAVNEKYTPAGYIPEFPSWAILPLVLTVTLFSIIIKKQLHKAKVS
jgi:N-acetylneuraminic acid mutarotase